MTRAIGDSGARGCVAVFVTGSDFACAFRQKLRADVAAMRSELQSEREGREEEREGIMQEMARIKSRWVEFRLMRYDIMFFVVAIALRAYALRQESQRSVILSSFTLLPGSVSGYKKRRQSGSGGGDRGESRLPSTERQSTRDRVNG